MATRTTHKYKSLRSILQTWRSYAITMIVQPSSEVAHIRIKPSKHPVNIEAGRQGGLKKRDLHCAWPWPGTVSSALSSSYWSSTLASCRNYGKCNCLPLELRLSGKSTRGVEPPGGVAGLARIYSVQYHTAYSAQQMYTSVDSIPYRTDLFHAFALILQRHLPRAAKFAQ